VDKQPKVVLVVEPDPVLRDQVGGWLEGAGFEVLACPGPSYPEYTCILGRGLPCALAEATSAVVLDLWLASDSALRGTSSRELLRYYLRAGKPVVALTARPEHPRLIKQFLDEPVTLLEWPPERRELCETVGVLLHDRSEALPRTSLDP
jgi:CheY-like chemotaxis protein